MYLFGYGSLINLNSAQKSFKRKLTQDDLIPVSIEGYKKVWNAIENIEFSGEEVNGIFLNLKHDINNKTNGVLIKITEDELEVLKLREKNYTCISIDGSSVFNYSPKEKIITFMTTNNKRLAKINDKNSYIPSKYIEILTNSFTSYDNTFANEYKLCLADLPFPIRQGSYLFTDSIQQKIARDGLENK